MMLILAYSEKAFAIENSLDAVERRRASLFRFDYLREQYTFAHAFKRQTLNHYFPLKKASEWRFDRTSSGKPFIKDGIAFNLSHSAESVAMVLVESNHQHAVGVDIECYREMTDLETMIDMVCHADEKKQLESCRNRQERFFQLWTAKEALLKACGSGLIDDLSRINCQQSLLSDQVYQLDWLGEKYCLKSFSFAWGVITLAWSADLFVSDIQLDNWGAGSPVTKRIFDLQGALQG